MKRTLNWLFWLCLIGGILLCTSVYKAGFFRPGYYEAYHGMYVMRLGIGIALMQLSCAFRIIYLCLPTPPKPEVLPAPPTPTDPWDDPPS